MIAAVMAVVELIDKPSTVFRFKHLLDAGTRDGLVRFVVREFRASSPETWAM
ncbi:MAG: hypothetical protein ACYTFA_04920 [Planctomycetota bacterium]|jgi:hypothetical protein